MIDTAGITNPEPRTPNPPKLWILADNRAGNVSQCMGVAERLNIPFETKKIHYNQLSKLPNCLLPSNFITLMADSKTQLAPPYPDLLIAAGRRTAPIAVAIKKRSGGRTKLIQLMDPGWDYNLFDLVVVPHHDKPPERQNQLKVIGAPHHLTYEKLIHAEAEWEPHFHELPSPRFAVILGGSTRYGTFSPHMATQLGKHINSLAESHNASLMVSTSRRTGEDATDAFLKEVSVPNHQFCWLPNTKENPYFGMLACADAVIMTGDSMSMLSEACFTGKPVLIADQGAHIAEKHCRFHQQLYDRGYAKPLDEGYSNYHYTPLDEAETVAYHIKQKFF